MTSILFTAGFLCYVAVSLLVRVVVSAVVLTWWMLCAVVALLSPRAPRDLSAGVLPAAIPVVEPTCQECPESVDPADQFQVQYGELPAAEQRCSCKAEWYVLAARGQDVKPAAVLTAACIVHEAAVAVAEPVWPCECQGRPNTVDPADQWAFQLGDEWLWMPGQGNPQWYFEQCSAVQSVPAWWHGQAEQDCPFVAPQPCLSPLEAQYVALDLLLAAAC